MSLTELQTIRMAALLVAGIAASWKFQYQALYYLLVVLYACTDVASFILTSFIFIIVLLANGFIRGATKD